MPVIDRLPRIGSVRDVPHIEVSSASVINAFLQKPVTTHPRSQMWYSSPVLGRTLLRAMKGVTEEKAASPHTPSARAV
jgi:hypothetical protein